MNLHDRDIRKAAKEEGRTEKAIENALNFLKMKVLTPDQIAIGTGLPLEKVLELQNLEREDVQIFYIRKYAATAVLDLTARNANVDIDFTIEMDPLGCKNFSLSINTQIDYPLLPIRKSILDYITKLELEGKLPC